MHPHRKKANADHEAKLNKLARGGLMMAGAESGVGRLQKAAHHRKVVALGEGAAPKLRADQVARRARGGKVKKRDDGGAVAGRKPLKPEIPVDNLGRPAGATSYSWKGTRPGAASKSVEEN